MFGEKTRFAWSQRDVRSDFHNFTLGLVTALTLGLFWVQISSGTPTEAATPAAQARLNDEAIERLASLRADVNALADLRGEIADAKATLARLEATSKLASGVPAGHQDADAGELETVRRQAAQLALRLAEVQDATAQLDTRLASVEGSLARARADLDAQAGHSHDDLRALIAANTRAASGAGGGGSTRAAAAPQTPPATPPQTQPGGASYLGAVSFVPTSDGAFTSDARFVDLARVTQLPGASRMSCAAVALAARPDEETFVCLLRSDASGS